MGKVSTSRRPGPRCPGARREMPRKSRAPLRTPAAATEAGSGPCLPTEPRRSSGTSLRPHSSGLTFRLTPPLLRQGLVPAQKLTCRMHLPGPARLEDSTWRTWSAASSCPGSGRRLRLPERFGRLRKGCDSTRSPRTAGGEPSGRGTGCRARGRHTPQSPLMEGNPVSTEMQDCRYRGSAEGLGWAPGAGLGTPSPRGPPPMPRNRRGQRWGPGCGPRVLAGRAPAPAPSR